MREPSIITNPEFLTCSYVPDKLLFREKERAQLLACLVNGINIFVYGPVGSGKRLEAAGREDIKALVARIERSDYSE